MYQPQAGDLLKKPKGPFTHYGIYLGNGMVFHNSPTHGEHQSTFTEFAGDEKVTCVSITPEKRSEILNRLSESLRNAKQYNILFNNCEHTIFRILSGEARSPQLVGWGLAGLCIVILIAVFATKGKGA
jgi:hypothetical protein